MYFDHRVVSIQAGTGQAATIQLQDRYFHHIHRHCLQIPVGDMGPPQRHPLKHHCPLFTRARCSLHRHRLHKTSMHHIIISSHRTTPCTRMRIPRCKRRHRCGCDTTLRTSRSVPQCTRTQTQPGPGRRQRHIRRVCQAMRTKARTALLSVAARRTAATRAAKHRVTLARPLASLLTVVTWKRSSRRTEPYGNRDLLPPRQLSGWCARRRHYRSGVDCPRRLRDGSVLV